MAKKHRAAEGQGGPVATPPLPEVELPEMSGYGIAFDGGAAKWNAVRVTNYGVVELLSPRPESKHAATARALDAFKVHIVTARKAA